MNAPRPVRAFVAVGANLGDRRANIRAAVAQIAQTDGVTLGKESGLIENPAIGGPADSPAFLNGAIEIFTTIPPQRLLARLLEIEANLGRTRRQKWEPRLIDLDLLLYGDCLINEQNLQIPHPRLHKRRFVLVPLTQIGPEVVHPTLQKPISALLDELVTSP